MNRHRISLLISLFMVNFLINGCASLIYKSIPLKDVAKTSGKYFVGTQNFQLVDSTRSMWFTDDIKSYRTLSVKMWYPADENSLSERAPYVDQYELIAKALSTSLPLLEELCICRSHTITTAVVCAISDALLGLPNLRVLKLVKIGTRDRPSLLPETVRIQGPYTVRTFIAENHPRVEVKAYAHAYRQ